MQFNEETYHGTHYTQEQFDATLQEAVQQWIEDNDEQDMPIADRKSLEFNLGRDLHREWNPGGDENFYMQFSMKLTEKIYNMVSYGNQKESADNPYLEPIQGITLRDYSAANAKIAAGVPVEDIVKALGVEKPVWDEASTLWVTRMQEDSTFTVINLMSQYFAEAGQHPKLGSLQGQVSGAGADNLQRMRDDVYFYHELAGARQAAYEYGLDGAQWIQDNYGINLSDFQSVAMQWMEDSNKNWNSERIMELNDYETSQKEIYAEKFAAEQGGNAADDINF